VGKIAEKAVSRSVLLTTWHCILSAVLTKMHSFRLFFWRFCPLGWWRMGILCKYFNKRAVL